MPVKKKVVPKPPKKQVARKAKPQPEAPPAPIFKRSFLPEGATVGSWVRLTYDRNRTKELFPLRNLSKLEFWTFLGKILSLEGNEAEIELLNSSGKSSEKIKFDVDRGVDLTYTAAISQIVMRPEDNGEAPKPKPTPSSDKKGEVSGELPPFDDEVIDYK